MLGNSVIFECTSMAGMNPNGVITPDEYGYRQVVLGALNVFSRKGEYYALEGAKQLLEDSSLFQRKVQSQALRGELGHPMPLPGQTEDQFIHRIRQVVESRVCLHIRRVWLDYQNVKDANGQPIIAIMGELAPSGELGHVLEKAFKNPYENVAFSIRVFSNVDRSFGGHVTRKMREIVTWDYVLEPGIREADKYYSPMYTQESNATTTASGIQTPAPGGRRASQGVQNMLERTYTRSGLTRALKNLPQTNYSQESFLLTGDELLQSLGWVEPSRTNTGILNWR